MFTVYHTLFDLHAALNIVWVIVMVKISIGYRGAEEPSHLGWIQDANAKVFLPPLCDPSAPFSTSGLILIHTLSFCEVHIPTQGVAHSVKPWDVFLVDRYSVSRDKSTP